MRRYSVIIKTSHLKSFTILRISTISLTPTAFVMKYAAHNILPSFIFCLYFAEFLFILHSVKLLNRASMEDRHKTMMTMTLLAMNRARWRGKFELNDSSNFLTQTTNQFHIKHFQEFTRHVGANFSSTNPITNAEKENKQLPLKIYEAWYLSEIPSQNIIDQIWQTKYKPVHIEGNEYNFCSSYRNIAF